MSVLKYRYDGPRWAKTEGFAKELALYFDLECQVAITKGWLTESGVIVCKGSKENLEKFKANFESAADAFNS